MTVTEVFRRHSLSPSVLYRWRVVAQGGSAVALKRDAQRKPRKDDPEAQPTVRKVPLLEGRRCPVDSSGRSDRFVIPDAAAERLWASGPTGQPRGGTSSGVPAWVAGKLLAAPCDACARRRGAEARREKWL